MYYFQNETRTRFIKFDGIIATIVTFGDGLPSIKKYDTIWDCVPFGMCCPAIPKDFEAAHDAAQMIIKKHINIAA